MPRTLMQTLFGPSKTPVENPFKSPSRPRVFALPAGFSGCAFWRYRLPFGKLKSNGRRLDVSIADNPNKQVRLQDLQEHIGTSDLISMQAPGYKDAYTLIKLYKSEGKKVVVDYDDYSFDLSPGNPRYAELGTKETSAYASDGTPVFEWKDGQNGFDLKSNIAKFEAFKDCVKSADLVTTTTEYLASKFRAINPEVAICPNSIDFDLWRPIPRPESIKDQVRIGWFGGDSHFEDIKLFKTLLPRVCRKYPQVKIVMQAPPVPQWAEFFKDVPENQMEWHGWADLRYYPLFLASRHWDIGLCPLEDNDFNRCKSSIKFFEFAAVGAAVIAQNMLPYSENINGENGLLAATEDEWFEKIGELVEDEDHRRFIAEEGLEYVEENFNLSKNWRFWEDAFIDLIEGKSCGLVSTPRYRR